MVPAKCHFQNPRQRHAAILVFGICSILPIQLFGDSSCKRMKVSHYLKFQDGRQPPYWFLVAMYSPGCRKSNTEDVIGPSQKERRRSHGRALIITLSQGKIPLGHTVPHPTDGKFGSHLRYRSSPPRLPGNEEVSTLTGKSCIAADEITF